jgi:L-alanine-DL-glutamate epimerase-like enolase superfamily enzyme
MGIRRVPPLAGERIARVLLRVIRFEMQHVGAHRPNGEWFDLRGAGSMRTRLVASLETEDGSRGDYAGGNDLMLSQALKIAPLILGFGWNERERFYEVAKRKLKKNDRMGVGVFDCALWDLAGKRLGTSVSALLGGSRARLPCYASTWLGGGGGGLDQPADYVAFAEHCAALGYRGFKFHGWVDDDPAREARTVRLLGRAVGDKMALMIDPGCHLRTFADAVLVGRACDDANFFWYEDPFSDGGQSALAHQKLRSLIRTPLLIGENIRGLESVATFLLAGGTDFVRADPDFDMGITGTMKIAHLAEALGLDVEIHAPGPAQRACMSAIRNSNFYEMSLVGPSGGSFCGPLYACNYRDTLDSVGSDGHVEVPQGPGLGVTYDWERINRETIECFEYRL